jgi:hypothetical protein
VTNDEMSQHFDEVYSDRLLHEHLPCYNMDNDTEDNATMNQELNALNKAVAMLAALEQAWIHACNNIELVCNSNSSVTEREVARRTELKASRRFLWAMRVMPSEAVARYTETR